jgi:hypothetical protein
MIEQFQKLDELIIQHTQPPVRAILRHQLSLTREQVEAYQASSDKQDKTLQEQAEMIEQLMKEISALKRAATDRNDAAWREIEKKADEWQRVLRSKMLNHNF